MFTLPLLFGLSIVQSSASAIKIDPLLIVQADEIWSVIGRKDNAVWPGWDARRTPILIYFPGKQDLLINHPHPPVGFRRYDGPLRSKAGPIYLREGTTIFDSDGQNTSHSVDGVETLVVADTLSNRRQWAKSLAPSIVAEPAQADKIVEDNLTPNPYGSMLMFAHEAFHVYQRERAPKKSPDESALLQYPSLSIENNVGYAQEADRLGAALREKDEAAVRRAALEWLAIRLERRRALPKACQAYEDATEFTEGLAKYVEYHTLQVLDGHRPAKEMWLVQGFHGFADLASERERLVRSMEGFLIGANIVNGDPYGASPVRFRLYFSGMAIGALLDRLGTRWHDRIFRDDVTLTGLVEETLKASPPALAEALTRVRSGEGQAKILAEKRKLAEEGKVQLAAALRAFDEAPGELVIDYSALKNPDPKFTYTSFGILRVDEDRNLFRLTPFRGQIGGMTFAEDAARPVLHDRGAKSLHFQLTSMPDRASVELRGADLALPGVALKNVKGRCICDGRRVVVKLTD